MRVVLGAARAATSAAPQRVSPRTIRNQKSRKCPCAFAAQRCSRGPRQGADIATADVGIRNRDRELCLWNERRAIQMSPDTA